MPSGARPTAPETAVPHVVVLTTLFPSAAQRIAGIFIRERVMRVAEILHVTIVSPQPWFPGQGLVRRFLPHYRPGRPSMELDAGVRVYAPRFFALPGLGRRLDPYAIALSAWILLRVLRRSDPVHLLDAHFAYPDGYAGYLLSRWLDVPFVVTLRGKEQAQSRNPRLRRAMSRSLRAAAKVITVSDGLAALARSTLSVRDSSVVLIPNGVDSAKFVPGPKEASRRQLGLPVDAPVLVSVGGLVERKGFHRVLECLPALRETFPRIQFLIVGGPGPEGDYSPALRALVERLSLQACVRLCGEVAHAELAEYLSAADVFVLATRQEGRANVFLEAMACGLPVVTTRIPGNAEVVSDARLGTLVPLGDAAALTAAIADAIARDWDRGAIRSHAAANSWSARIATLVSVLREAAGFPASGQ